MDGMLTKKKREVRIVRVSHVKGREEQEGFASPADHVVDLEDPHIRLT
jgi:hypothetical protein